MSGRLETSTIRILVADDHGLLREGLRRLLEAEPRLLVVGEAADGVEAVRLTRQLQPDLLLLDWTMPRMSGVAVLRELAETPLETRVIILAETIEKTGIQTALGLGARGVVLKEEGSAVLIRAIRAVAVERYWVGREGGHRAPLRTV